MVTLFTMTIDTEEEWDWNAGWPVRELRLSNIQNLPKFQALWSRHGVATTYFTNQAVLDDAAARAVLLDIAQRDRVEIGMHIHPWNTPPIVNEGPVRERETFLHNLPDTLALAKLTSVHDRFAEHGLRPTSFRGGRYSSGGTVQRFLQDKGFLVDSSVVPFTTWKDDGAPDYRHRGLEPVRLPPRFAGDGPLWEVPLALLERFECDTGDIVMRGSMNYLFTRTLATHFAKRDVAAAYQRVLEEVAQRMVRHWLKKTGLKKIALSGGVNANVKLNQRLREIEGVEQVFVYPNMGDGGCGSGAAMLAFGHEVMHTRKPFADVYFGPDYSAAEVEAALEREGLAFERLDDIEERVAHLLTQDHIIGRFNGRMEYGPRALGNRSVLYPAREPEVNQWLNHQLGRTEFMPFAPAALASEGHRLYRNLSGCEKTAEFMTITFDCADEMQRMCPAAVHIDGTARPQLVSERSNESFHKILRAYYERSGIPATINTSFNMHEEPIVCGPEDGIRAFLQGNIDYLAIGPFLVPHPKLRDIMRSREEEAEAVAT